MNYWIAVVDDEVISLKNARNILGQEGLRVSCLRSGGELLRFLKEHEPDLILLDVMMPQMDGFETFQALRRFEKEKNRAYTPVIFLTGDADFNSEQRGLMMGASDYIRKPFDKDILLRRIENAIRTSRKIESLTEDATTDRLTGFWNKAGGVARMKRMCAEEKGAFMILDMDSFKLVNDLYGHEMGDAVLSAFGDVMRRNIRKEDLVCRIGGDEFMAFFCNITNAEEIGILCARLNEQILTRSGELMGEEHGIPLGISIGAVMVPEYGRDYEKLFSLADEAMYAAKQSGRHRYCLYKEMEEDAKEADADTELSRMLQIIEERNDGGDALILGSEAFSTVYHYIKRFNNRYGGKVLKVLFVLKFGEDVDSDTAGETIVEFGDVLKRTLRRSDIIMKSKSNQYFLLCPMMTDIDGQRVIDRILEAWSQVAKSTLCDLNWALEAG